ncbi:glycosyltransferase family 2 protein [Peloplasma aerotolerans]|uniref:Glycosyltransferase n=1 Tax=Peloplasma aerotolerans TaxID=3044389 RepID=A0AAW6U340_9MOLU|nr:glycosyltransferase [Mariniplasma sp. M4Ah]MDI6452378.1 glycosyltransferase [Mariniplasma sp. M4Ah]
MDLISFIIPIYNAGKFLSACIESILHQTYENIELILIDDGSTDNSLQICQDYADRDSRIRVITKSNSGVSSSRNIGIKASHGKYISFVDSDDILDIQFSKVMQQEITQFKADCVFSNYYYLYNNRAIVKKPRIESGVYSFDDISGIIIDDRKLSGILFGSVWAALYKKDIIDKYRILFHEELRVNEDGLFNIEYCSYANLIRVCSHLNLYYYRQVNTSTSKKFSNEIATKSATETIKKKYQTSRTFSNLNEQLSARYVSEILWHILKLCGKTNIMKYKNIKNELIHLLNDETLRTSFLFINKRELNISKKIYLNLMLKKKYRLLFIVTRYIYPVLSKILPR